MNNPWKEISLSDYESHMSLDSVKQLQSMNRTMRHQFESYDVHSVMILGVAGGNGLDQIDPAKYHKVYGVDINADYLKKVEKRYESLSDILECLNIDILHETDRLPGAELVIANLLIEYVGYSAFSEAVSQVKPRYVSCVIQINDSEKQWVSDSPYLHAFDGLDSVHHQMDEENLTATMNRIGYRQVFTSVDALPNGKSLVRLDYASSGYSVPQSGQ